MSLLRGSGTTSSGMQLQGRQIPHLPEAGSAILKDSQPGKRSSCRSLGSDGPVADAAGPHREPAGTSSTIMYSGRQPTRAVSSSSRDDGHRGGCQEESRLHVKDLSAPCELLLPDPDGERLLKQFAQHLLIKDEQSSTIFHNLRRGGRLDLLEVCTREESGLPWGPSISYYRK